MPILGWWKFSIKSKVFTDTIKECSDKELLEAYNDISDLNATEKGWKTKRSIMIQEMGYRGMSFSI